MIGPITVIAIIFLIASVGWLLKNKISSSFFGKFKTLKKGSLDLGKISSILVGWIILHVIIMLSTPDIWDWYVGKTRLFLSVQIMVLTIALLMIFGGKLGSYLSIGIATVVAFGFAMAILQEQPVRQQSANVDSPVIQKKSRCGKPKIIIATSEKWSDSIRARVGCDWITRTDESAGFKNARLCFKARINGRNNLILTECGTSTEDHLPGNQIARNMEFKSVGGPVQIKINFVPSD